MALTFALLYVAFLMLAAILFRVFHGRILEKEYRKLTGKSRAEKLKRRAASLSGKNPDTGGTKPAKKGDAYFD